MKSLNKRKSKRAAQILRQPARFAELMLRQNVWTKQREILESVANNRRTAVKACHASGKTFIAASAVLWWITSRMRGIAVTTAPTWTQVERLLWGEIHAATDRARIAYPKPLATELRLAPERYAIGLSTNEGVRFQGFHGDVLIVIDEAPGVKADIWEAVEGVRAGGDVRVLALGNPILSSGPFYDAFTSQRDTWNQITISAFDTPNLEGLTIEKLLELSEDELDSNERPYLTTRRWVKEKYGEWGPAHPLWESRVLGNFPTQADDALISLSWIEASKMRQIQGTGDLHAGIDVAGPGESETVLVVRDGSVVVALKAWAKEDPRGELLAELMPLKDRLKTVCVDSAGLGHYLGKHLQDAKLPVREINVGESPLDSGKYVNRKAELYWGLRMRFERGEIAGLSDEKTIGQLSGIRYQHTARGQVQIETKAEARKRGVKSPDRAEALMLAFATPRPEPRIRFFR